MIIGQNRILSMIDGLTIDKLAHSIVMIGKVGSGKRLISRYIADKFNLEYVEVSSVKDYIDVSQFSTIPSLYVIDGQTLSIHDQNAILKTIEEPTSTSYTVITAESQNLLLDTIKGRCYIISLDNYSYNDLKNFTDDDLILSLCETPGQVEKFKDVDIKTYIDLADSIFSRITNANIANVLTISRKLSFSDNDKDNLNIIYFNNILINRIYNIFKENISPLNIKMYDLTRGFVEDCKKSCDKQRLFENYLFSLKECSRNEN